MNGNFGVFDHTELLAEFGADVDAEEYLGQLDGHVPQLEYGLLVAEIPEDYPDLSRSLSALYALRNRDLAVMRCLTRLRRAQEVRYASA